MPIRPFRHRVRARLRLGFARWDRPALIAALVIGLAASGLGVVVIGVTWRSARQPDAESDVATMTQPATDAAPANGGQTDDATRQSAEPSAPAGGTSGATTSPAPRTGSGRSTFAAEKYPDQGIAQFGALGRSWRDPAPLAIQLAVGPHPPPSVAARLPRVVATVPASALGFAWPLRGYVTSSFDDEHPLGIDIAPSESLGLNLAARDGRVLIAGGDPCCSYGYFVLLDHGDGLTSIYGHFRDAPEFRPGEWVERGTVLGIAGDTGQSFGVHLHFEVRLNGLPVDPQLVLTAGFLSPLIPRATSQPADSRSDATATPPTGEPESERTDADPDSPDGTSMSTPAPSAPEADRANEEPEPSAAPSASPSPVATPTATAAPSASPSPSSTPTARPSASPTAVPSAAPSQSPTPTATPPAPSATPSSLSPSPSPTFSPSPSPSPSPTPSASPTPSPTPTPVPCITVRYQAGGMPPLVTNATAPFIGLEVETGRVGSLIAERCGADGAVRITATPIAGQRCSAGLYAGPDTLVRVLTPAATADDRGARWTFEAGEASPGRVVRLACTAEGERDGG